MKVFTSKIKTIAFTGKESTRTKIVLDNKVLEQVRDFSYVGEIWDSLGSDYEEYYLLGWDVVW